MIITSPYLCKMRTFFCGILFTFSLTVQGQLIDSIQSAIEKPAKFLFKMDARHSFLSSLPTKVKGVKVGLNHDRKFAYGIGYNWMSNDYWKQLQGDSTNVRLNYASFFINYVFHDSEHWNLSLPIQMGYGFLFGKDQQQERIYKDRVFIWEPAMTIEYKFLRYFGVGFGTGYRLGIKFNQQLEERITAPIYVFRFNIYFDKLYKDAVANSDV